MTAAVIFGALPLDVVPDYCSSSMNAVRMPSMMSLATIGCPIVPK